MASTEALISDSSATESDMDVDDDPDSAPNIDSAPFSEGEKVLAFHSSLIYEAKVRKIEYRNREWRFFVHYLGWSKNWDEWVGLDRLLKFTEENVQKQQALVQKQSIDKNTKQVRASQIIPKIPNAARAKKRKNDAASKEKGMIPLDKLANIQIPPPLKKQLVDDCDFITHLGKLVKLPRAPNVDEILKKYLGYRMKKDNLIADSVGEILKGLRCYFDKALPAILLYKSERRQYKEAISVDVSPSTVYGAEHLLRLFVKLPELLYYANIEEETLLELQQELVEFLKFLQKHRSAFFLSTYHVPEDIETSTNK
ncbi:protein MRG2-like isoform X1 [Quercus lobata]|uniref:protein MRG2-like isoform X1 n=1 Tax=Quercus lobata TaxID=97700 RepID=UPI0012469BE6|nr:protein MRG2-like isoform X1 [Quercus lobata]